MNQPPVILIVEDDSLILQAITKKMAVSDLKYLCYTSGKQAIDYLNMTPNLPDAVWLDYHLPDMEGDEFMKSLNKDERYKNLPVIVVSNSISQEKVDLMLSLGVKKYLLKSNHRLDELIAKVKECLNN